MSLINNMLKDLAKRETSPQEIPYIALTTTNSSYFSRQRFAFHKIASISLVSIAAIGLIALLLIYFHTPAQIIPATETHVTPVVKQPAAIDQTWITPVAITGVTIQIKDNVTELTFLLNHAALYRLVSNSMQNKLSVIIDQASLQSEIPPIHYMNTAIQRISTSLAHGNSQFDITMVPGSSVKYVNLTTTGNTAELVVAIDYQTIENHSQPIKAPSTNNMLIEQYQAALNTAESGQVDTAIQHLTALLKINPRYNEVRTSLAALLIDQGQSKTAKHMIDTGLNNSPEYVPFIELKARILATEGNSKQALALLQTASPPLDENPDYHALIAAMHEQNNHFLLAANIYRQLLELNASKSEWWFGLGVSLDKLGHNKQAINAYIKASSAGHLNAESYAYLQSRLQKLQEISND